MKNILFPIALVVSALLLGGAGINHFIPETTFPTFFTPSDAPLKQPEFRKTTRKQFGGKLVVTYTADIASGTIGIDAASPVDDPYDNVFHFMLDEVPAAADKVWLCYDLKGVHDHTAVARSINTRQSVGGQLVAPCDAWSQQQEYIDGAWLQRGDNVVRFSLPETADYYYAVKDLRIVVEKTANHAVIPVKKDLVVNQPSTRHFGDKACLKGFISGAGAEKAQLFVGNTAVTVVSNEFEYVVERPGQSATPWYADLRAVFPDGTEIRKSVVFDTDAGSGRFTPTAARGLVETARFLPNDCGSLEAFGVTLELPEGAIKSPTAISVTALRDVDLPALEPDMVNVTLGHRGFRFLPDGFHFEKNVHLGMPYDPALIPGGYTEKDIRTYYFDETDRRWKMTPFDSIAGSSVVSATNHFTDYINGIIKVPESPQTQGYKPTEIKDLKVSDASAGIVSIAPPQANNMGTANLSFPIKLPAGRHGMQPQLAIQYNSEGGNGWLGVGWDISAPSVSIDTRWGVPRYDPALETETYLMGGDQLTPLAHRDALVARVTDREYHPRVEGAFQKIIRHGSNPKNYYWEVVSKEGMHSYYGGTASGFDAGSVLKDDAGNIAQWFLGEMRDANENFLRYEYVTQEDAGVSGGSIPGRNVYVSSITYTGHGNTPGKYKVEFVRDRNLSENLRVDKIINCRLGLKQVTADRLRYINISYQQELIRSYELVYMTGAFEKNLLAMIAELDAKKDLFYQHTFEYYDQVRNGNEYQPYKAPESWTIGKDNIKGHLFREEVGFDSRTTALGASASNGYNVGAAVTVGPAIDCGTKNYTAGGSFYYSKSKGNGLIALADINGDALPDKIFLSQDGNLSYRPNLKGQNKFGDPLPINGIRHFNRSTTKSKAVGLEANLPHLFLGYTNTKSRTVTSTYFSDFNGDGLMDIAHAGRVYFNRLDADKNPTFNDLSTGTPNPVVPGSDLDQAIFTIDPDEEDKLIDDNPLHDVVRVWVAPYDGTIQINAPVRLIEDTSQEAMEYTHKDGIRAWIQINDTPYPPSPLVIDTSDYDEHLIPLPGTITVKKDDHVYFRLQSKLDGAYDLVHWDPEINYLSISAAEADANGYPNGHFKSSEDFLITAKQTVTMAFNGEINISGRLIKPVTSDSITIQVILKNNTDSLAIFEKGYGATDDVDEIISFDTIVKPEDDIMVRVASHTNVAWDNITFVPEIRYNYALDDTGNQVTLDTSYKQRMAIDFTMFNDVRKKTEPLISNGGMISVKPFWALPPNVTFPDGTLTLSVKGENQLYGSRTFTIMNGIIPLVQPIEATIAADEKVYIEYHIENPIQADSILDHYIGFVLAEVNGGPHSAGVFTTLRPNDMLLGSLFRGWGQFIYDGNRDRADQIINKAELILDPNMKDPHVDTNIDDPDDLDTQNVYDPTKARFIVMIPDIIKGIYRGYDDLTWLNGDMVSSSRMGEDDVRVFSSVYGGNGSIPAPEIVNESTTHSIAVGLNYDPSSVPGLSLNGSYTQSWTETKTTRNGIDMNGDRYIDQAGQDFIQYTDALGGLEPSGTPISLSGSHHSSAESKGFTAGGTYSHAKTIYTSTPGQNAPNEKQKAASVPAQNNSNANEACATASISAGLSGNFNSNYESTDNTWLDINGDGLPDKVYKNGNAALNLGYQFDSTEYWGFDKVREGNSLDIGGGVNLGAGLNFIKNGINKYNLSFSVGISLSRTEGEVTASLLDMNGDGLVDIVASGNPLMVRFNTGCGFSDWVKWNGVNELGKNISTGASANGSFTIGICLLFIKIAINPGGGYNEGVSREILQIMDADGDGFPDVLRSDDEDQLIVQSSTIGRTNMLKTVNRPMHSSFTMTYELTGNTYELPQSKWLLSSVDLFDGLADDGADHIKTTFAYENGEYNRRERDFYGFKTVTTRQLDTDNNDNVYRTITQTYKNDNYYEKGLLISEIMYDQDDRPFTETINTYELRDAGTGGSFDPFSLDGRGFPALVETEKRFYEGDTAAGLTNRIAYSYDNTGNVIEYTDYGDGNPDDVLTAKIDYHNLTAAYILSMPKSIEVLDFNGARLRYRDATIDGKGNVTQIRQYLESGDAAVYDMAYEANGNLQKLTRPANTNGERLFYEYTYDPEVQTYVTHVKDAYGYESQSAYDYAFGQVVESIDMNQQRIKYSLDAKGRIDTVVGPYELARGLPFTIVNSYNPEAPVPYATTKHFDPANNGEIVTITFMDGLQRPVQVKKTGSLFVDKNQPDQPVMIVSGRVIFDAFGRTVKNYYPVTESISGGNNTFNTTSDGVPPTVTTYDVLDRKTSVTLPDGAKTTSVYSIDEDNSGYTCFKTLETDPLNSNKETYTDIRNRTRAVKDEGPNGGIWTDFRYNLMSELLRVTDNGSNVTEYTYDQLGRRLSVQHPDAGLKEFEYDLVGNLIAKTTPNTREDNQSIKYTYEFERLVQIDYPKNYQNMVRYTYGKPGDKHHRAGRVWLQEDASGGQEFFFGPLGEVVKNIRTVLVSNLRLITYVSEFRYDTWNRIDTMIYPDGEVVKYRYNKAGKLSGMNSSRSGINTEFVGRLGYDKFEQRTFLRYGNGTETVYTYEDDRRRLKTMTVTNAAGRTFMDNRYEYDAVGNILSLNNIAPIKDGEMGGPAAYTYKYDELYRLKEASGNWTGPYSKESFSLNMEYDDLHNIQKKTQKHLRDGLTQSPTSYNQAYDYDQNRPHVPVKIGNLNYQFDANGNMTGWTEDITNRNRFIRWDEEDRIRDIWEDGYVSQYTYDAGGERIVKSHGGMSIAYTDGAPAGMVNHRDNFTTYPSAYTVGRAKQLTKHYYIESQRFLSKIAAGDLKFLATDQPDSSYITAGNINYQGKMKLLAQASSLGDPAPPTPGNPPHPLFPADEPVYQEGKPNQYWYNKQLATNDNVKAGFNLVPGSEQSYEANMYYYHPDHLGSTGYVTDYDGKLRQHVEYLPFGETFVEEHLNSDPAQPYLYNAKEYDAETRLYYYGARYYDPKLSIWVSVDPMTEKYPGWSPYNYCSQNPIICIDPDGNSTYLIIYGSGWVRPDWKGGHYDVGSGFKESAYAMKKQIESRKTFNSTIDKVHVIYAPNESDYVNAINNKYDSGLIKELDVYSHGSANSINLGGNEGKIENSSLDADYRMISAFWDPRNPGGENEIQQLDITNFTADAAVTLRGCNLGGNDSKNAQTQPSHAKEMAKHLGKNRTVKAFSGGGGAEFKTRNGKNVYDGSMIRSSDRNSQKENLTEFKK